LARHLVPLPYAGNAVVAAAGLRLLGDDQVLLGALASGARRSSVIVGEDLSWPPRSATGIAWEWAEGDTLLALVDGRLRAVTGAVGRSRPSVDFSRSLATVTGLPGPAGEDADADALAIVRAYAQVATAAALVGAMHGTFQAAVAYAKDRQQFGRPIGSFQAVQHMCSEMLVDTESARSALYGAAWAVEHASVPGAVRAAGVAKAWCGEAAVRVCETAMQVQGGMGMTWEYDGHLYLRACHLAAAAFGGEAAAIEAVAAGLFDEGSGA